MKRKILVVDDEQNIREIIKDLLSEKEYEVTTAVDGQDALDKMNYEQFDLFILDIYMPRMDGMELMQKIKEKYPLAVVIITTGYSSIDGAINAIRGGAFHYITKPIIGEELLNVVDRGMDHYNELAGSMRRSPEDTTSGKNFFDTIMLRNFSSEEKADFHEMAIRKTYEKGETIPLAQEPGTIILLESGSASVYISDTLIENLEEGQSWGEESFIPSNKNFTTLRAKKDCVVRHYNRNNIIEFFKYHKESLLKLFMINLMTLMYLKWKKSMGKIAMFMGYSQTQEDKE
ncbi:MAG: response regulator [Candidatus Cloacimonadota bacterium]|nr:response regulator [Candidatus Cloacimonadota bacterium]